MKKRLLTVAKTAVTLFLLWLVFHKLDWGGLGLALRQAGWWYLGLAFLLHVPGLLLSVWRWQYLLAHQGQKVGLADLSVSYLVAQFFNIFLPTSIGGDVSRAYDTGSRVKESNLRSLLVVMVDRLTGLASLLIIGSVSAVLGRRLIGDQPDIWAIAGLFFAAFVGLGLLLARRDWLRGLGRLLFRLSWLRRSESKLRLMYETLENYSRQPRSLAVPLVLAFLLQVNFICHWYFIGRALHLPVPLGLYFVLVPIVEIVSALPVTISGIGLRENAYVFFLGQWGVDKAQAVALPLVYFAMRLMVGLIGGLVFVARRESDG